MSPSSSDPHIPHLQPTMGAFALCTDSAFKICFVIAEDAPVSWACLEGKGRQAQVLSLGQKLQEPSGTPGVSTHHTLPCGQWEVTTSDWGLQGQSCALLPGKPGQGRPSKKLSPCCRNDSQDRTMLSPPSCQGTSSPAQREHTWK